MTRCRVARAVVTLDAGIGVSVAAAGSPGARVATAQPASAPRSASAPATITAGRNPSVNAAGDPSPPYALNTALATATPKTAPKRCNMLFVPEAGPLTAMP